jgi:hypothetical protein
MIWNLVRSIYGRSSIENTHIVLIHLQTWLPQAIPVLDWLISKNLLIWNCFAKMNRYLVGSTCGRFCIKFPQSRMKGERHRLSPLTEPLVCVKDCHWLSTGQLFLKVLWRHSPMELTWPWFRWNIVEGALNTPITHQCTYLHVWSIAEIFVSILQL